MVAHSRAALGSRDLRPLNVPTLVEVELDSRGQPRAVRRRAWRESRPVVEIQDHWRIDDEWWREHAISRLYQMVLLADGMVLVLYRDLIGDDWYEQRGA